MQISASQQATLAKNDEAIIDPVCWMNVDITKAKPTAVHHGMTYHCCSEGGATQFRGSPEKYLYPREGRILSTPSLSSGSVGAIPVPSMLGLRAKPRQLPKMQHGASTCGDGSILNSHVVHLPHPPAGYS